MSKQTSEIFERMLRGEATTREYTDAVRAEVAADRTRYRVSRKYGQRRVLKAARSLRYLRGLLQRRKAP